MTLKSLFQKRRTRYIKDLMKYAKIIFNDHFVLLFFILIGAGGFAYSEYLKTISFEMVQPRILVAILFFVITSTGSVTLLLEPADQIFLLPKEQDFKTIFKRLVTQSYLESLIPVAVVAFITFPILVTTLDAEPMDGLFIFLALASLKGFNYLLQIRPFFEGNLESHQKNKELLILVKAAMIFGLLFIHVKGSAIIILAAFLFVGYQFYNKKIFFNHLFNWERMIDAEDKRLQNLYRFIGMFANVPNIQTNIKRLAWLDPILDHLTKRNPTASYYYILRLVMRNTEYSLLIIRATIVGVIILAVTESALISAIIVVLFLYIIGFQLLTLVNELNRVPLFQIYPITDEEKEDAVQKIIFQFLLVVSIVLTLASLNGLGLIGLATILFGGLFAYLFSYVYAPKRMKQNI